VPIPKIIQLERIADMTYSDTLESKEHSMEEKQILEI